MKYIMNFFIAFIAILLASFTHVRSFNSPLLSFRENQPRSVHERQTEFNDEYRSELLRYYNLLENSWNGTRFLIQDALDANNLPLHDVIASATENITKLTATFDKEVAYNCTLETQRVFRTLYHQATPAVLGCITVKPQATLVNLLKVRDAIDDALQHVVDNEKKYNLCSSNDKETEQQACQKKQIEILHSQQGAATPLIERAKAALAAATTMPMLLKECTEPVVAAIQEKVLEVVNAAKDCPKNVNTK